MNLKHWRHIILFCIILLALSACQAIFTYSPLAFLQLSPKELNTDQLLDYSENALSGGDRNTMEISYEALKLSLIDLELTASQQAKLNQVAGNIAVELSGVGEVISKIINKEVEISTNADVEAAVNDIYDISLLMEAGNLLLNAKNAGADLSTSEILLGALGVIASRDGEYQDRYCQIPTSNEEKEFTDLLFTTFAISTNDNGVPQIC